MSRLHHRNVVRVFGLVSEGGYPKYIIMERANASLDRFLRNVGRGCLSYPTLLRILRDVLRGLKFMHTLTTPSGEPRYMIHFDIKAGNILAVYDERCVGGVLFKLSDYGTSRFTETFGAKRRVDPSHVQGTTPWYLAPDPVPDMKVDVYALGLLASETALKCLNVPGKPPRDDLTEYTIPTRHILVQAAAAHVQDAYPGLARLLLRCTDSCSTRATSSEALEAVEFELGQIAGEGAPGLNVEMACPRVTCPAVGRRVVIPLGFGDSVDLSTNKFGHMCRSCGEEIPADAVTTFGVSQCMWTWHGRRVVTGA